MVTWTSGVTMDVRVDTGGVTSTLRGSTGELLPCVRLVRRDEGVLRHLTGGRPRIWLSLER